ncbi:MAG: CoA transferase [Candidatus Hydrogenedentota bacterium]
MTAHTSPTCGPLAGVHVVDFSSFIAGAFAATVLGDMGASIVKVESLAGDAARQWGPFLNGESRMFQGWNRNKRSIAVDLRSDKGREIVYDLVRRADIVVENFRPGITHKLKIDYPVLKATNEKLIYLSITAFGTKGPYGERPGYDPILQALTGAARGNIRYTGNTGICSVAISDFGSALLGACGLLAALYHRERTGQGQFLETTLLQAAMTLQSHMFVKALDTEEKPPLGIFPYQFYRTKDDIIFLACGTDRFWQLLCEAIGAPEWAENPRYKSNAERVTHTEELKAKLEERLAAKTTKEWSRILVERGVPCAPPQTYEEWFGDPQVAAMDMNPTVQHTTIGRMQLSGIPIHFQETPGAIQSAPPTLGEHTDAVLTELGYSPETIASIREAGVVR